MRKLQRTGGSTFTVSLPKEWVSELKLGPGDPVYIRQMDDASLLITSRPGQGGAGEETTIRVSPDDGPHKIARRLVSFYLIGYSTIRIAAERGKISPAQRRTIREFVKNKLVGAEMVVDLPEEIVVRVLIRYPDFSVKDAVRRMAMVSSSMVRDALRAVRELDRELAVGVVEMDDEVDRFGMYVIRQLKAAVEDRRLVREIGLSRPRDCLGYRLIVKSVERIGDHAVAIAKNLKNISRPVDRSLMHEIDRMGGFALETFGAAIESLFAGDGSSAEKILSAAEGIERTEQKIVLAITSTSSGAEHAALRLILESLRRVVEYSCDIAEVVLNLVAEEGLIRRG